MFIYFIKYDLLMKAWIPASLLLATAVTIISIDFPDASAQRVFGDYLVRIPPGATQEGGVHYEPAGIAVPAGTTVVWVNDDPGQPHTVTSGMADSPEAQAQFHSGVIGAERFFSQTFNEPGEYVYHCEIHPGAVGRVSVSGAFSEGQNFVLRYGAGSTFDFTEHERSLLTFEPTLINIAEDQAALYRITILKEGNEVFSDQFRTIGGTLHLELIPTDEQTRITGPDIVDPQTGAYHISGSFLKDNAPYSILAEIISVGDRPPQEPIMDEFGVQIVPEFPVAVLAAALAIGGTVAYGRFRGFFTRG
jgi:plastocyanin